MLYISNLVGSGTPCPIISTAVLPSKSLANLSAPFNSNALTGRVDFSYSTLFTARCRGVKPF